MIKITGNGVTYREMVEFLDERLNRLETKIDGLQNQLNNQKLIAAVVGGVAGIVSAIVSPFKKL